MKEIKVSSGIVYLIDFDVVREKASPFPCCRKDNYIVESPPPTPPPQHTHLLKPLFPNCQFFLIGVLNIYFSILITCISEFLVHKTLMYIC